MNQSRIAKTLREEASRWWVRLDRGEVSAADRKAFEAWREQSSDHQAAFAEVCAFWGELDELKPCFSPKSTVASSASAAAKGRATKRFRFGWAVAATLLTALIVIPQLLSRVEYASAVGELRTVKLEDGSTVYLGSDSALDVDFGHEQRRLNLRKGEAWFEVAHDPSRPFVVTAGRGSATALGTVYDVKHIDRRVQVTVIESRVAVDYSAGGSPNRNIVLGAGEQSAYSDDSAPSAARIVDLDSVAAWRRGWLTFENKALGEVIGELNRYHRGLILISDRTLRDRPVNGVFRTDRPTEVVAALESSLGLKSTRFTDYLILLHR